MPQREYAIKPVSGLKSRQATSTLTNCSNQQPEFIFLTIDIINGNRTTQKRRRGIIYAYLDKLPRIHLRERLRCGQLDECMYVTEHFRRKDLEVQQVFFHLYVSQVRAKVQKRGVTRVRFGKNNAYTYYIMVFIRAHKSSDTSSPDLSVIRQQKKKE